MEFTPLPFDAPLEGYQEQAERLLADHRAGDDGAFRTFHQNHPRFLDEKILWLPKRLSEDELRSVVVDLHDARLALARSYCFRDWPALETYVSSVADANSGVFHFESAVEAVVNGELTRLRLLLDEHPELVRSRSTRATKFDPPVHRATLLHYVAANGVEGYRQKTPPNAVEIATALLEAGAEADATADLYGSPCTTMTLLVSSSHPAQAGLQVALAEALLDFGSALEGLAAAKWGSPLMTALALGYPEVAEALVRRGARVDNLAAAAGLGRTAEAAEWLPSSDSPTRHRALALAAQLGRVEAVRLLLDAGEDPNRYNPEGHHAHSTPLHQAALAGHDEVVRLLTERGARLDIEDRIYRGTPLDWAVYSGQDNIARYLRQRQTLGPDKS